jgi:serine/threonine protein kinase
MGVVYLAEGAGGHRAALKVIRSDLADDAGFRQRFAREVTAARMVRSPVTAAVLAADPSGDPPWVAFEFIEGPNLADVIARGVPRLSAGLGILGGVAEALVAIHGAGLVHRDLKPANVLVAPSGVVVIDFGIAAALDATTLTRSGMIGTPGWLAPEQVRGERVTFATDSFAWGMLAMYTTTGRHPFGGPDQGAAAYLYRIANESPDLDGLPPELYGVVSATLSRDPDARPSADDLVRALLPVAGPDAPTAPIRSARSATALIRPQSGTDIGPSPPCGGGPRKRKRWMAAAVALAVAALAAIALPALATSKGNGSPRRTAGIPTPSIKPSTRTPAASSTAPPGTSDNKPHASATTRPPGTTAPPATTIPPSAATAVEVYMPYSNEGLAAGFTTAAIVGGSCWTGSLMAQRTDAWRCMVGNYIYDPCFSDAAGDQVACPSLDNLYAVVLINITQPLPEGSANTPTSTAPWEFQLADGPRCQHFSGAVGPLQPINGTYPKGTCGTEITYFGDINQSLGLWTVLVQSAPGSDTLSPEPISRAWE